MPVQHGSSQVDEHWKVPGDWGSRTEGHSTEVLNDPHKCLMEMFDVWLARPNPPPTWEAVVGEGNVAKEIREIW